MRTSKFTVEQISHALRRAEGGVARRLPVGSRLLRAQREVRCQTVAGVQREMEQDHGQQ